METEKPLKSRCYLLLIMRHMKTLTKRQENGKLSKKDHLVKFDKAHAFFNNPALPKTSKLLAEDDPYSDKDGLIEFIVGTEIIDDPIVMAKLAELKKIMVSLTSVVTDYVFRYAEAYGEEYKTDAKLWAEAANMLPLMGPSSVSSQTYSRHIEGVKIAIEFIEMILDIATEDNSAALTKFKSFLTKQGESIRLGVDSKEDGYNTLTLGVALEAFMVGETIFYAPKIKQYGVNFDRKNYNVSFGCGSYEKININFDHTYAVNIFDYEALEDAEIKEAFDKFVSESRKAQIESGKTFFNADFPPKVPAVTNV